MLEVDIQSKVFNAADGGALEAIGQLNFSVPDASFTSIVGPSGCGKSTTLRIILGLDNDYDGLINFSGQGRMAAVFQEPCLLPWRSVEKNVRLVLPDGEQDKNLDDLFDVLGLSEHRQFFPGELSLGLARRVSLARAFALSPELLVLDEPFVSLDDDTAARLRNLTMKVWRANPVTALMVTHSLREAAELSDRIIFLSKSPATVLQEVVIDTPRSERDDATIDNVISRIKATV